MTEPTAPPVTVRVDGASPYDVVIGTGLLDELIAATAGATTAALLHPESLKLTAEAVQQALVEAGVNTHLLELPDAEDAKTAAVAAELWSVLGRHGFTRTDVVVGLGGGTVTDLAGFVAATWLRGVPVVQVPTTLLGMVDAAVGGKTGINTDAGKNMAGAFYEPAAVIADLATLESLPKHELVAGLAVVAGVLFASRPGRSRAVDPRVPVAAEAAATR